MCAGSIKRTRRFHFSASDIGLSTKIAFIFLTIALYYLLSSLNFSFRTIGVERPLPHVRTGHLGQVGRHLVDACCRLPLSWMCLGRPSQHVRLLGVHCLSLGNVRLRRMQFHQPQNVVSRRRLRLLGMQCQHSWCLLHLLCMQRFCSPRQLRMCSLCPLGPCCRMRVRYLRRCFPISELWAVGRWR